MLQGGRDKLGWVRQLVRYTETHPILVGPAGISDIEAVEGSNGGAGGVRTTVFPALQPAARREDVVLLQAWLADTMTQLAAQLPLPATGGQQVLIVATLYHEFWMRMGEFSSLHRMCREQQQHPRMLLSYAQCESISHLDRQT